MAKRSTQRAITEATILNLKVLRDGCKKHRCLLPAEFARLRWPKKRRRPAGYRGSGNNLAISAGGILARLKHQGLVEYLPEGIVGGHNPVGGYRITRQGRATIIKWENENGVVEISLAK